ncbi:MAG: hypothetical protein DRI22_00100 [Caldiserica bacterium]|nr:MAG: hypothetical protein DRI22_00100 [Caldisericota bacterium]
MKGQDEALYKHYSFSTLTIPCMRAMWRKSRGYYPEVLKSDETEEGLRIHKELAEKIKGRGLSEEEKRLKDFLEQFPADKIHTEMRNETYIRGYKFVSVIDVMIEKSKNEVILIDHKTTRNTAKNKHFEMQLRFYSFPFILDEKNVETYIYYTKYDYLKKISEYFPFDRNSIEQEIINKITAFKLVEELKAEPEPEPCWFCSYCPYIRSCPSVEIDERDPEQLASEILKTEARLKSLKKLMRAITQDEVFEYQGKLFGYHPVEKVEVEGDKLFKAILEKGGNPFDYISWTKKKVERAVKELGDELSAYVSYRYESKWDIKNKEKEE